MRIAIELDGSTLASTQTDGRLMLVPDGLRVRSHDSTSTVLEPMPHDAEDMPDWLVGTVPLVVWSTEAQRPRVVSVEITPPPPFAAADVRTMWEDVVQYPVRPLNSIQLQGRTRGSASIEGSGLHAEAVPAALGALANLKRRWPELETSELIWRPFDVRGGVEDARATDRLGAARGGLRRADGRNIPDLTARRRGASLPWGSKRLASACFSLEEALAERSKEMPSSTGQTRRTVISAARRSLAAARGVDHPPSSWPAKGRLAFKAVLRALVALFAEAAGNASVPLCDLWRLYEAWTVVEALEVLTAAYGAPERPVGLDSAWQWHIADVTMRMHAQGAIGAEVDPRIGGDVDGVVSVSSQLVPDVLLSLWREGGGQAVICADAKQRTSGSAMKAGDIAEAASKYLWGLRLASDPNKPATATVIVVSSAPIAEMFDEPRSRIRAVHLLPNTGYDDFAADLLGSVAATIQALFGDN